ncbi:MAG: adenylate kinase [Ignavibacteriaceae bacterium]|nr:MAG: adenylate kinase [Chlorobiota bacterium]MBV6399035.1 adenylate kinase [Ignavibacteria bacterium]MCC6885253.1 adenylate kinase [Ignavibacteriales bacterium]MCE7953345.1 adenylate kinase [Chlorobi bacterium CHB7]MDL1887238.1 adenylate kinase [Ignavibacteria bacterium CHB1]MEB2330113.1 adenylate kinase [Ignavibacteriaceae bacterium]RIK48459.1 MAG: adenylate kinase [Ignavibacteriota bacterium]
MYRLIIFGPPGAGKGTQAEIIADKLNLDHFSTGQILREAVTAGTDLGKKAKAIMDSGHLVPDEIMIGIVEQSLAERSESNGFILDGFPRTLAQAIALTGIFSKLGFDDVKVINLIVKDEELIERMLSRGRSDDTEDAVKNRLAVYKESTAPVLDYFRKNGNAIFDITGAGEINDINDQILKSIT